MHAYGNKFINTVPSLFFNHRSLYFSFFSILAGRAEVIKPSSVAWVLFQNYVRVISNAVAELSRVTGSVQVACPAAAGG